MKQKYLHDTQTVKVDCADTYQMNGKSLLSSTELKQLSNLLPSSSLLAKRLAAKQALFSCLLQINLQFDDYSAVSILHDAWGKPYFSFSKTLHSLLHQQGITSALLSISDEKCTAYAYVVLNRSIKTSELYE